MWKRISKFCQDILYLFDFFLALTAATYSASILDSIINSWHFDDYPTAPLHSMFIYPSVKWPLSLQLSCNILCYDLSPSVRIKDYSCIERHKRTW